MLRFYRRSFFALGIMRGLEYFGNENMILNKACALMIHGAKSWQMLTAYDICVDSVQRNHTNTISESPEKSVLYILDLHLDPGNQ